MPFVPGERGIRHEDTVAVTADGCENLAPKWSGTREEPGWCEKEVLCHHERDMKTIAISIDEESLAAVDRLAQAARHRGGGKREANRSEVVRRAVREFIARHRRHERQERDRRILGAHRDQIERQAASLVAEQAEL